MPAYLPYVPYAIPAVLWAVAIFSRRLPLNRYSIGALVVIEILVVMFYY